MIRTGKVKCFWSTSTTGETHSYIRVTIMVDDRKNIMAVVAAACDANTHRAKQYPPATMKMRGSVKPC